MTDQKTVALSLLGSVAGVDMKTSASTTLFTVPPGKTAVISHVIVRNPSASLAGGTSYSFTNWRQTVDLSAMTGGATRYFEIDANNANYAILTAGTNFQITVTTGASAAGTATIDVFGYFY